MNCPGCNTVILDEDVLVNGFAKVIHDGATREYLDIQLVCHNVECIKALSHFIETKDFTLDVP